MATEVKDIIRQVRTRLGGKTTGTWPDADLRDYFRHGCLDLWGAILDVHGGHYIEEKRVVLKANESTIGDVPENCFRVQFIEPWNTTSSGDWPDLKFTPKRYNSEDFRAARSLDATDVGSAEEILYDVTGVGAPIQAPLIRIAPQITTDLTLRLAFNPTVVIADYNPIPGESDNALIAWVTAWARSRERQDRMPDPGQLAIYATEKQSILTRMDPRQEQEPPEVVGLFDHLW